MSPEREEGGPRFLCPMCGQYTTAAVARAASSLGEREALEARLARAAHMLGAVLTRSAADDFDRDRVSESFDEVQAVRRALTSQEVEG